LMMLQAVSPRRTKAPIAAAVGVFMGEKELVVGTAWHRGGALAWIAKPTPTTTCCGLPANTLPQFENFGIEALGVTVTFHPVLIPRTDEESMAPTGFVLIGPLKMPVWICGITDQRRTLEQSGPEPELAVME
jgi:hypothetical protein